MSLVNFSLTNTYVGQPNRSETTSVGFSREGGKVDYLERSITGRPSSSPSPQGVPLTGVVQDAADGVRAALTGAGLLNKVVVHNVGTTPHTVDWTYRNAPTASAPFAEVPSNVLEVIAAVDVLERAALSAPA